MGFWSVSNKLWPTNQQWNELETTETHLEVLATYFLKILVICHAVQTVSVNCLFSERNTSPWTPRGCLCGGLLYFIEAVERHPEEKQKLVIRGEIPAIWPAIRGDREMSAVCETLGRVSVLFAPTAHVKVKSDSSLNPLWTSLTACVIWNAPLPLSQNFCHASPKRQDSDGDLVLRYVTERSWDLLVRCLRYGWLSSLDSAGSVSSSQESHWALVWFLLWKRV